MTYTPTKDGEWISWPRDLIWRISCCDCGLVHDIDYRLFRTVELRVVRNKRATASRRRNKKIQQKIIELGLGIVIHGPASNTARAAKKRKKAI